MAKHKYGPCKPCNPCKPDMEDDYRAQDDLRTLIEAEKIRGDGGRLKKAMYYAKEQMSVIKKVESA